MSTYAIRTHQLSRRFGAVRAVEDLTIDAHTGSVYGFLGPNGAGKTTTIRLLLGLLEPDGGQAEVLGYDVRSQAMEIRSRCGALLEHDGLYERLNAEDNLEFYARIWRLTASDRRSRIQELLDHLGLWDRRREPVRDWSRGMRQKLAMARALLHRPALLFLDEPSAGLDPVAAAKLRDDLADLVAHEGVTVFLTTHNLAEAEKLCHQIGIIRQGKLIASGAPTELRAQAGKPSLEIVARGLDQTMIAYLKDRAEVETAQINGNRLVIHLKEPIPSAPLVTYLVSKGIEVEEVVKSQTTLEEVFLNLMEEDETKAEAD
jgi:ABC-2 type transport system ATP-binding protein